MDTVTEAGMAIAMAQVSNSLEHSSRIGMDLRNMPVARPEVARVLHFARMQLGGMGFIHYNCTLAEQAAAVEAVKSHQPGCAPSVTVVAPDATVADVSSVRDLLLSACLVCM